MKKLIILIFGLLTGVKGSAQFTYPNSNEIHTNDEIVAPVIRVSNELRLANTFAPNDPIIGTLDNTGYGINISKTSGIGFALNNVHRFQFNVDGSLRIGGASITDNNSPGLVYADNDDFLYDGEYVNHYGLGFHKYKDNFASTLGTNSYLSGYFGIDLFTGGRNRLRINNNGNVGIGTTSPYAKLHVNSNADVGRGQNPAFLVGNRSGLHIAIDDNEIGAFSNNVNSDLHLNGSQSTSNTVINGDGTGKVGIGTMNPQEKLQIGKAISFHDGGHDIIAFNYKYSGGGGSLDNSKYSSEIRFDPSTGNLRFGTSSKTIYGPDTRLTITKNGDVAIGTTDSKGYKLAVAGDMIATEIKVKLQTSWPDYVFKDTYNLPTLNEVEQHIQQKGHLINIPSATEVAENGIYLGEMNAKLLEKIEELTLYTIAQEKEISAQKIKTEQQEEINQQLLNKNAALEARLARIEALLNKE